MVKKLLVILVVFGLGVLVDRGLLVAPRSVQAGAVDCAVANGDVNADGSINLSDAVTILGHLFQGSPVVLAPLCSIATPCGLPDTGQEECFSEAGDRIPCDSEVCPGQDGHYATGCPNAGRFVDNQDGTVTDNCTSLQWQKGTADANGDGQGSPLDSLSWCRALEYCERLDLGGRSDWRLPSIRELQSIADYGRFSPAVDPVFDSLLLSYWSSTVNVPGVAGAWTVQFYDGKLSFEGKANAYPFRAVRSL